MGQREALATFLALELLSRVYLAARAPTTVAALTVKKTDQAYMKYKSEIPAKTTH